MVIEMDIKSLVGAKVKFINNEAHERLPMFYPPVGTEGIVRRADPCSVYVSWKDGSTSGNDTWSCSPLNIEVIEYKPLTTTSWIEKLGYGGWGDIYWECGSCHKEYSFKEGTPLQNDWYFCPKCGTKKANEIRIGENLEDESK